MAIISKKLTASFVFLIFFTACFACAGRPFPVNEDVQSFIKTMNHKHGLSERYLRDSFERITYVPDVIENMDRQAESLPWYRYKDMLINKRRIRHGVNYYFKYPNTLRRALRSYGVDGMAVTAIIGIESHYGKHPFSHKVADALATLAFFYPRRAAFFKEELANFLIYCAKNRIDPLTVKGSYAGAIGIPQFMPGSILIHGVDFSRNGKVELCSSNVDAIGSVANYLKTHGWEKGGPMAVKVYVGGSKYKKLLNKGIKPKYSVRYMKKQGVRFSKWINPNRKGALISLEGKRKKEYWVVFQNFYAVTKYNNSVNYAMSVALLRSHIKHRVRYGW